MAGRAVGGSAPEGLLGSPAPAQRRHAYLLQLQLALPLPHDVALFQQLFLGFLKLFLPLEARHKDWAESGAPLAWGSARPRRQPPGGTGCQTQAHAAGTRPTAGTASQEGALQAPSTNCGPLQGARLSSLPRLPYQESHPNPSPWHTGPVHPFLTTGPWHLLTKPEMLPTGVLSWHPGLCAQRPTFPSPGFLSFPMPVTIFVFALLQNPSPHTQESCFCPAHWSSSAPASAQGPFLAGTAGPRMTWPRQPKGLRRVEDWVWAGVASGLEGQRVGTGTH